MLAPAVLGAVVLAGVGASMPATAAVSQTYIVVLDDSVADPAVAAAAAGVRPTHVYRYALKGYAAPMSMTAAATINSRPNVRSVEPDGVVRTTVTQSPATWGLDRIDQRNLPLNNSYVYTQTGAGVKAYILDTGIRLTHNEFGGRASVGFDAIGDGNGPDCNGGTVGDGTINGHGTHVAGTAGGSTYGVATGVTLISVRVLDCFGSGSFSQVIAGVDWVTGDHGAGQPAVANMSLGGGFYAPLNTAVTNSIADGVSYAISAGNENQSACNVSPASTPNAITLGATTNTDARSSFSNWGTCLDLFAPGSGITSAWNGSNSQTSTISGTSMASPHAAGAAALLLQANPTWTPTQVRNAMVANATAGGVGGEGAGSPDLLLYTGTGDPPPPPGSPTISSFTPTSGPVTTSVAVTGTNFTGTTFVKFNGLAGSFTVNSPTSITALVPVGATTGKISVTNASGTGTSAANFTVTPPGPPTVSNHTPQTGPVGTVVTFTGTNLVFVSSVKLGGTTAVFTSLSATKLQATVPSKPPGNYMWQITTPQGTITVAGHYALT